MMDKPGRNRSKSNGIPGLPRDDNGLPKDSRGRWDRMAVCMRFGARTTTSARYFKDGGKTFSRARAIIHTAPIMFAVDTLERANGFPQIAIDPRSRRLYVTWSDYRNGDLDVFCSTSTDGGKKWSEPARVNDDPIHDGADQFFQWLAVDPIDGAANVVFYDRRGDPRIARRPLPWHAQPMADAPSRITLGLPIRSKRAEFSWATTRGLPHPAAASMGFGPRSRQLLLKLEISRRPSLRPCRPSRVAQWLRWGSLISDGRERKLAVTVASCFGCSGA